MKNLLLILFSFLILISCNQKHSIKVEVTESDYYKFLNDVLEDKTIIQSKLLNYPDLESNSDYWKENLILLTNINDYEKMSEILTDSDVEYIFKQHSSNKKLELDFDKLKIDKVSDKVLKDVSDYLQSEDLSVQKKYDYFGIYYLTLPLFSKDKEIAFFEHSFYCGLLCAFNGIEVYKLINGKWELIGIMGDYTVS